MYNMLLGRNTLHTRCSNGITNASRITLTLLLRRKPVLDNKYYVNRFNAQIFNKISGLGTFINNIESIGQDGCMT